MKTSRKRIANIIAGHVQKEGSSKKYARTMASFLLEQKRTGELDSLLRDIQAAWAKTGYVEAITSSAHPLSGALKNEITDKIKKLYPAADKIVITEQNDPALIGGVRISLPEAQLDLSVQSKLNKFKQLTTAGKV